MICTVRRLYFDRGACCFWPETKATNCVCSCVRSLRIVTSRMDTLSFVQRCAMWPTHYAKLLGERKLRLVLTLVLGEWVCCVLLRKTVARKCLIAVATLNENANVTNGPVWHCKLLGPKSWTLQCCNSKPCLHRKYLCCCFTERVTALNAVQVGHFIVTTFKCNFSETGSCWRGHGFVALHAFRSALRSRRWYPD